MSNKHYLFIIVMLAVGLYSCQPKASYINQKPPGITPQLFMPSIVNTDHIELNGVFNQTLTEFFFTRIIDESYVIYHSKLLDGKWTSPEPIQMFPNQIIISVAVDMSVTQDGNTMYFLGQYPGEGTDMSSEDIYQSQKVDGKWQLATKVPYPISTDDYTESYPVVVADGSLYFESDRPGGLGKQDVYRAQYLGNGKFDTPKSIGSVVNTAMGSGDTFVSPDESYLIVNSRRTDAPGLYVSFKKNGDWQKPIFLKEPINSEWTDFCPYMTPDSKYFFFSRRYSDPPGSGWAGVIKGEVYWVDANVIFSLNEE